MAIGAGARLTVDSADIVLVKSGLEDSFRDCVASLDVNPGHLGGFEGCFRFPEAPR